MLVWQLTSQLIWSNVEEQYSLRGKMAHVAFHLCRLFFKSSRKRRAGTDLSLFHTVFTGEQCKLGCDPEERVFGVDCQRLPDSVPQGERGLPGPRGQRGQQGAGIKGERVGSEFV